MPHRIKFIRFELQEGLGRIDWEKADYPFVRILLRFSSESTESLKMAGLLAHPNYFATFSVDVATNGVCCKASANLFARLTVAGTALVLHQIPF